MKRSIPFALLAALALSPLAPAHAQMIRTPEQKGAAAAPAAH